MGLNIYYIGYVDKKPEWNVNSVNPLYLMINGFHGTISEKNGVKYLTINDINKNNQVLKKYNQVFDGLKYLINKIGESDVVYKKNT